MSIKTLACTEFKLSILLVLSLFFSHLSFAQNDREIKGTVYDSSSHSALSGVSISVKGKLIGSMTNSEGAYSIQAESSDVLVFSSIGFEDTEVPVGNKSVINVSLKNNSISLQEVVAVGYQVKKRGEITGAISDISGSAITATSENNITQAIQGKIPGVIVNDRGGGPGDNTAEFLIRGKATLGDNSPLIVIDGVPRTTQDFSTIASNDIESITVLKDASAAIYGARAANGVILITTKKGRVGTSDFTLSSDYGIQSFTSLPPLMNSYQRAIYFNEQNQYNGVPPLWSDEALQHFQNGDEPLLYPNTNWPKAVLSNTAPTTHHNLSARGGNDKVQYYVSGDYLYEKGLIKSGDLRYNQMQLRSNITAKLTKDFTLGVNLLGRQSKRHAPGGLDFDDIMQEYPWTVVSWPNGSLEPGLGDFGRTPVTSTSDKYSSNDAKQYTLNSTITGEFKVPGVTGLSLSGYMSFDYNAADTSIFNNLWDVYNYDPTTDVYTWISLGHQSAKGTRDISVKNDFFRQSLYHAQINYNKFFGKHNINTFIAYEQSTTHERVLSAYRQDLPTDEMPYIWAGGQTGKDNNGFDIEGGRVNYFGSLSYGYNQKYYVDFTLRRDGSFNFAQTKRFGTFPSVSASWNMDKESFMKNTSGWLNNLKLRASWGEMGNDLVPAFQYLTIYGFSGFYAFGESPVDQNQLNTTQVANPNITWEKSKKTDIGLDFIGWNSMLSFSLDLFSEKRRDILIARHASIPDYTALSLPDENLGKVDNNGVEFSFNLQKSVGSFQYRVGGMFTYTKDKIVFMDEAKNIPSYQRQEGHPLDSWLVYEADGIFKTQDEIDHYPHLAGTQPGDIKYIDVDGDGSITGNDQVRKYSSATPRIQFSFNPGIRYKNFDLDIFFQGQAVAQQNVFDGEGIRVIEPFYTDRWTPENPNAKFPRAFDRDDDIDIQPSTMWLYSASFLRLKNVKLTYTLPQNFVPFVKDMDVYINGRNLVKWDNMLGRYDPERTEGTGFVYPQVKTITFGLDIHF